MDRSDKVAMRYMLLLPASLRNNQHAFCSIVSADHVTICTCWATSSHESCLVPLCRAHQHSSIVSCIQDADVVATPQATPRGGKKGTEPAADSGLVVGAFGLLPATAALAAGTKQIVTVNFKPEGARQFVQQVGIAIADR